MTFVLYIISIIFIITPFFPATENPHWFFRTADFVRLQSIFIEIICLVGLFLLVATFTVFDWILVIGLVLVLVYQLNKVYPYSSFYPRSKPQGPSDGMISIMAANVLQTNNSFGKFVDIIKDMDPDLVLAMESNKDWEENLSEIEKDYPHSVKIPLENFYGMLLYSKHPLNNVSTQFQIEEHVPSIYFEYAINDDQKIFIACLHPAPPSPTENETSKERDAELMLTARHIQNIKIPVVVCGDMNDVVWSRVTRMFKKMTNMIDPRIGRGFFPTYHAGYRFMRFPLDHLFHSKDLFVGTMKRTPYFDSDHFGMYYEIHYKNKVEATTNGHLNKEDREFVEEILDSA